MEARDVSPALMMGAPNFDHNAVPGLPVVCGDDGYLVSGPHFHDRMADCHIGGGQVVVDHKHQRHGRRGSKIEPNITLRILTKNARITNDLCTSRVAVRSTSVHALLQQCRR